VNHTTPGFIGADGQWERIWFPDGPPPFWNAVEGEEARYTEEDRKAWDGFRRTGGFEGRVPREPPQGDWCRWDF
jgi:nucleoporin NUP42